MQALPVQVRKSSDSEDMVAGTKRPGERPVTTMGFCAEGKSTPEDGGTTWTKAANGAIFASAGMSLHWGKHQ